MNIHEEVLHSDDKRVIVRFEVPGGYIYRNVENYFKKNQYGETSSITFVPYGPLKRLSMWLKSFFGAKSV